MKRWRSVCAVLFALQLCGLDAAGAGETTESPEARAERRSTAAERAAVETQARSAEAECRRRFAVSGCVADVQAQQRAALAQLRERELVLDEAKRNGARLPVTALVDQFYADVQQMGGGRWDTSSLVRRLK